MASLYESLSEEDRKKVDSWAEERKNPRHKTDVPHEFYTIAELGYYYGWGAVEAFYRGYIADYDEDGKLVKRPFTLPVAMGFIRAAKKFNYRRILDEGDINAVAGVAVHDKNYGNSAVKFANAMREEAKE